MKSKRLLVILLAFFLSALTAYGVGTILRGNRSIVARTLGGGEELDLGLEDYKRGEYEEAIAHFSDAIDINQKYIDAYFYRGLAFEELGEYEKAVADYDKTIELNPNEPLAYFSRGAVYRLLGSYDEAIADFNQAISLDPDYADIYFTRALVYNTLGELERAIADLDKAIALYEQQVDSTALQNAKQLRLQLQQ